MKIAKEWKLKPYWPHSKRGLIMRWELRWVCSCSELHVLPTILLPALVKRWVAVEKRVKLFFRRFARFISQRVWKVRVNYSFAGNADIMVLSCLWTKMRILFSYESNSDYNSNRIYPPSYRASFDRFSVERAVAGMHERTCYIQAISPQSESWSWMWF